VAHSTLAVLSSPDFPQVLRQAIDRAVNHVLAISDQAQHSERRWTVVSDYQRLRIARDLAAYRALGHIDSAICYCRQGDARRALSILLHARATYEATDKAIESYTTSNSRTLNGRVLRGDQANEL
jgi:hypothetical protein